MVDGRLTHAPHPAGGRILSLVGSGAEAGAAYGAPTGEDRQDRIRALRRRVYGRDARPEDVAALAAALHVPALPEPRGLVPPEPRTHPAPAPAAPRGWRVPGSVLLAAAGAALVGALVGAGLVAVQAAAPAGAPPAPPFRAVVSVPAPRAVLARAAGAGDEPAALVGPDLVARSVRRLGAYPAAGVSFWAARDRQGGICLIVADTYYRSACSDPATFAATGVTVAWSAGPGWPASTTLDYVATWRGGRVRAGPATP